MGTFVAGATPGVAILPMTGAIGGVRSGTAFTVGTVGNTFNTNNWTASETPDKAVDGNVTTKTLNFKGDGAGFIVSPVGGGARVTQLSFYTANDAPERDPASYVLYGSATALTNGQADTVYQLGGAGFTQIASGSVPLPTTRDSGPTTVTFSNPTAYASYVLVFPSIRTPAENKTQIAEVVFAGAPPTPTVTGVSPAFGPLAGGTSVTITGTNFTGATAVTFGGAAASFTVANPTSITAVTPAGSAGPASVVVTTSNGSNAANTLYNYGGPPPNQVNFQTNGTVTHEYNDGGGEFDAYAQDSFNFTPAPTLTANFASDKVLVFTVTAPPGQKIRVTEPGGSGARLVFNWKTNSTGVSPFTPGSLGTPVWENGEGAVPTALAPSVLEYTANHQVNALVSFDVTGSFAFTKLSVTLTLPASATASFTNHALPEVYAYFEAGSPITSDPGPRVTFVPFTAPAPTVTGVSPGTGQVAGGRNVTITGTNFTSATAVTFGGAAAASFTVASATSITAVTPAGSAGPASVVVTTANGSNAANTLYTYVTPPPANLPIEFKTDGTVRHSFLTGQVSFSSDQLGLSSAPALTANLATDKVVVLTLTAPAGKKIRMNPAGGAGSLGLQLSSGGGAGINGTISAPVWENGEGALPTAFNNTPTYSASRDTPQLNTSLSVNGSFAFTKMTATLTFPAGANGAFTGYTWPSVLVELLKGVSSDPGPQVAFEDFTPPAPTVTGVSPATGQVAGGRSVTITGTNFTGATSVTFGGAAAASFTVASPTSITAVTPAGSAGPASVVVTTPGGSNGANTLYTYVTPPPANLPIEFKTDGTVSHSAVSNPSFVSVTDTLVLSSEPTLTANFATNKEVVLTISAPPGKKIRVSPSPGSLFGSRLNLLLTNGGAAQGQGTASAPVWENGEGALPTQVGSSVAFNASTNTPEVNIGIQTPETFAFTKLTFILTFPQQLNGSFTNSTWSSASLQFSEEAQSDPGARVTFENFTPAPAVTGVNPASGPTAGGTTVTITGTNFTGATAVQFGGANATAFTVDGPTQITATTSAQGAGPVAVAVTTPGGTGSRAASFTFIAPSPEIAVLGKGVEIASGDTTPGAADDTDFGTAAVAGATVPRNFTITNTGDAALNLTGTPKVAISGPNATDFTVTTDATSPVALGSGTATFTITFDPSAGGLRQATVTVANDDSDEGSYSFAISGVGAITPGVAVGLLFGSPNTLIHFDPAGLTQVFQMVPISGVTAGETVVALDQRPANGTLLALAIDGGLDQGTLYTVDPATGKATPIGTPGSVAFVNSDGDPVNLSTASQVTWDMDVNPVADKVRVINSTGQNFRIDPVTGLPVDGDNGLATGGPSGTNMDGSIRGVASGLGGAGYTNSVAGATATTLYTIDRTGILYIQNPPNSGANGNGKPITSGGTPVSGVTFNSLDIPSNVTVATSNTAAAGYAYVTATQFIPQIGRLDLATGELTYTGTPPVTSFALLSTPAQLPVVTGPTLASLTSQSATLGGNVTSDGGTPLTERGVLISKTSADADPKLGEANVSKFAAGMAAVGVFTVPVTGLVEETAYSYRAYATNALGTTYTSVAALTTPKAVDFAGTDDAVAATRGGTRLYPLANDISPTGAPLHLVSVSNPAIVIDGRSLIIPANFTGTFTYLFSDGTKNGQATVTVADGTEVTGGRIFSGLLLAADGSISGAVDAAFTASGRVATLRLLAGTRAIRTAVVFPIGAMTASRVTALGTLTLTRNADGTVAAKLAAAGVTTDGTLRPRKAAAPVARYNAALASVDAAIPGGGYAFITTLRTSAAILIGRLPDGKVFVTSTSVRDDGTIAFYSIIRRGVNPPELVGGELVFANLTATDLTGELAWAKPVQRATRGLHLGGVNTLLTVNGCQWKRQPLPAGAGTLSLSGGNLAVDEDNAVTITAGRPKVPTGSLNSWLPNRVYGIFRARVRVPGLAIPARGVGVYLPKSNSAFGFFPGTTVGGRIDLTTR